MPRAATHGSAPENWRRAVPGTIISVGRRLAARARRRTGFAVYTRSRRPAFALGFGRGSFHIRGSGPAAWNGVGMDDLESRHRKAMSDLNDFGADVQRMRASFEKPTLDLVQQMIDRLDSSDRDALRRWLDSKGR